jgi:hypothetical protein
MNRWRVGSKVPINVYEGDRPVCQCQTAIDAANIVTAMNTKFDAPTGDQIINKPTFDDLSLSVRAFNCLHRDWGGGPGIQFDESASRILAFPNIHRVKDFGPISFLEVMQALLTAGYSRTAVESSTFFMSAPRKWQKLWRDQE